jgi:2-polyprenyl-3-methyl-5-hydroxy-6-metoxy-1,4-benzoquinol methylase
MRRVWNASRLALAALRRRVRQPLPGRFQPYSHTLPDRYPWLFEFAARQLGQRERLRVLSFGCSRGEEVLTLRRYFPGATLRGIDVDPDNIARARARAPQDTKMSFAIAADTRAEPSAAYDAIFCLAVLCLGDLTTRGARRSDPYLHFAQFEEVVSDLARCLKPGGLLFLHTTNFRFSDTSVAAGFEVAFEAEPAQLAPDVLFDRTNRLLPGVRYLPVGFRKRATA